MPPIITMRRPFLQIALSALALLPALQFLIHLAQYAAAAPVSFDGAMNLNVAASFASGEGYGFFYDSFFPFAAQTDGPYVLPAALVIHFFGVSPLTTQAVNLVYIGVLMLLLIALQRKLGLPFWGALVAALFSISVPGFTEFGMNGYGEIPMLAWYLAGLLAFSSTLRRRTAGLDESLAGVFLALAYLTKFVALVLIGPVFAFALLAAWRGQIDRRSLALLCAGFALPIALWEIFRFISIGDLGGYVQWWKLQFGQVLRQSGAKSSLAGIAGKAAEHFSILCSATSLSGFALVAFVASPFVLFIVAHRQFNIADRFIFSCLLLTTFVYFFWWLLVTPTSMAWLRRILAGVIIHEAALIALAYHLIKSAVTALPSNWLTRVSIFVMSAISLFPVIQLTKSGEHIFQSVDVPAYSTTFFKLASAVRDLPADAVIFGTGWWQAPGIALYSGRKFHNFQHWMPEEINKLKSKYFIFDTYTTGLARQDIIDALALTETEPMFKAVGGELYRIDRMNSYAPLGLSPPDISRLKRKMNFAEGDYEFKRGFYGVENNEYAWMRTDALVALTRTTESRLIVSLVAPDALFKAGAPKIQVVIPQCANQSFTLSQPWDNSLSTKLDCPPSIKPTPINVELHVDRHMPFAHQIDADNRLLSVLIRSIELVD